MGKVRNIIKTGKLDKEVKNKEKENNAKEKVNNRKILFWNIAGLERQDRDFWKYIIGYDYIGLCETWVMEDRWNQIKGKLPDSHDWYSRHAIKTKRRGRACGGIIIGKRKNWGDNNLEIIESENAGIVHIKIVEKWEELNIITVYNSTHGKDIGEIVKKEIEGHEYENLIIGGDFNIRIGEMGGDEEEKGTRRKSKDKTVGNGGKKFIQAMMEEGFYIMNGRIRGDWDGEYTYTGARGSTVIDYIFVNANVQDRVHKFRIEERVDSDHMPICMELQLEKEGRRSRDKKEEQTDSENKEEVKELTCWDEESRTLYREKSEKMGWTHNQEETADETWARLKGIILESIVYKEKKIRQRCIGYKDWWDRECTKKKRRVKKVYVRWRRGKGTKEGYMEERKNFRLLLEKKRKKKREEEENELRQMQGATQAWKYINKKRKRREWRENNIEKEE